MVGSIQELYDQHIKTLSIADRMQLIAITALDLAGGSPPQERAAKRDVMELHGLGAEIWNGIDAQDYVNALRDEWDLTL
jgi:hypothetical protein